MITFNLVGYSQIKSSGMDGCTRIFIECAKRWVKKGIKINVFTCKEGYRIYTDNGLKRVSYFLWPSLNFSLGLTYFLRTFVGVLKATKIKLLRDVVIYSGSDFWPDTIPAFFMKLRNPKAKWIAGFYLFAPKPWQKDSSYKEEQRLKGLFYWLTQQPIYCLVKKFADMVWVTSEPDVERFKGKRVVVVKGGVDLSLYKKIKKPVNIKYDAVFIGRLHPQKGVLELIDIWKKVAKKRPESKLAIIGDGELMKDLRLKIKDLGLNKNVELLGFLDGIPKIKIFKASKIVLHPAIYDSGGMAACEAMAAGLPGVSFDLESLKTYYPRGMVKTRCFDLDLFANNIINLLEDKSFYQTKQKEAIELTKGWDWDRRAEFLLEKIKNEN